MDRFSGNYLVYLHRLSNNYEIKVTLKPFKDQYIYLGHYFGKQYPIVDSAKLDVNSQAVFKGNKKLQGGIYLVGYPNKAGFFEILVDKQQSFSVIADTANLKNGVQFINSPDKYTFCQLPTTNGDLGS